MAKLVSCFAWFTVGTILALPYCLLVGWDWKVYAPMTAGMPAMIIIWFMLGTLADVTHTKPLRICWKNSIRRNNPDSSRIPLVLFWSWTAFCLLPLLIRAVALLLPLVGFSQYSNAAYEYRYTILGHVLFVALFSFVVLLALGGMLEIMDRMRQTRPICIRIRRSQ
jgi:hypothetical protein